MNTIANYKILEKISESRQSVVYLGQKDDADSRLIKVKYLP